jgi:hypothetical protein
LKWGLFFNGKTGWSFWGLLLAKQKFAAGFALFQYMIDIVGA